MIVRTGVVTPLGLGVTHASESADCAYRVPDFGLQPTGPAQVPDKTAERDRRGGSRQPSAARQMTGQGPGGRRRWW